MASWNRWEEVAGAELLSGAHRRYLTERGVPADWVAARGYRTVHTSKDLPRRRGANAFSPPAPGFPSEQARSLACPGLLMPRFTVMGAPTDPQYRPNHRPGRGGPRFVSPQGATNFLDAHPLVLASQSFRNRDVPLIVTEGVTRGDALGALGFAAVSLSGVWNWLTKDEHGYTNPIPDLRWCAVEGREIWVAFDNDYAGKPQVRESLHRFAQLVEVYRVDRILFVAPPLDDDHPPGTGIDDLVGELRARGESPETIGDRLRELARPLSEVLDRKRYRTRRFSELSTEPARFLWNPYVPRDTVTIFDGPPNTGKTEIALALAAAVSRGDALPAGLHGQGALTNVCLAGGDVLFLTEENSEATLRRRAELLGADLDRLHLFGLPPDRELEGINLREDPDVVREAIADVRPLLVVIDPLMQYMGDKTDVHRDNEVRPIVTALMRLASEFGAAVIAIRHWRKGSGDGGALNAGLGSIAFTATVRSVLVAAPDGEGEPGTAVLAHAKHNDTPRGASLRYRITNASPLPADGSLPIEYAPKFEWLGVSDRTADELVAPDRGDGDKKRLQAGAILVAALDEAPDGVIAKEAVYERAASAGISRRTVDRAAKDLSAVVGSVPPTKGGPPASSAARTA